MAVTLGHILPGASAFSNSRVLTKPNDVVENSLLVAFLYNRTNATTITGVPSGWTLVASTVIENLNIWTYQKVAGASEPGSYTWNYSAFSWHGGAMLRVDGADPAAPIGTPASAGMPDVASLDVGPVSTSADDGLFLLLQGIYDAGAGPSAPTVSGFTLAFAVTGANYLDGYSKAQATAGSSGTVTISYGAANYDQVAAHLLPIDAPASGPGTAQVAVAFGAAGALGASARTRAQIAVAFGGVTGIAATLTLRAQVAVTFGGATGIAAAPEVAGIPAQVAVAFGAGSRIDATLHATALLDVAFGVAAGLNADAANAKRVTVGFGSAVGLSADLSATVALARVTFGATAGMALQTSTHALIAVAFSGVAGMRDGYIGPGTGVHVPSTPALVPVPSVGALPSAIVDPFVDMREGDEFPVLLPWAGIAGMSGLARVLSRGAADEWARQRLHVQFIRQPDADTLPALAAGGAVRYREPVKHDLRQITRSRQRQERERVQRRR